MYTRSNNSKRSTHLSFSSAEFTYSSLDSNS
nr:MAG TPA: hypothetical protein [Caudoviricetes sp.]